MTINELKELIKPLPGDLKIAFRLQGNGDRHEALTVGEGLVAQCIPHPTHDLSIHSVVKRWVDLTESSLPPQAGEHILILDVPYD